MPHFGATAILLASDGILIFVVLIARLDVTIERREIARFLLSSMKILALLRAG